MRQDEHAAGSWTRAGLVRGALGAVALGAGGAIMGVRGSGGTSAAAPSRATDADILNLFLLLERAQEAFYREAQRAGRLTGELLEFARTTGEQEGEHVAFLEKRLGRDARARTAMEFAPETLQDAEEFRTAAIELEEAAIAAYIGQSANLTRAVMTPIATVVAVEARQAAWIRDVAGTNPAPNAADPGRKPDEVLDVLRERGILR